MDHLIVLTQFPQFATCDDKNRGPDEEFGTVLNLEDSVIRHVFWHKDMDFCSSTDVTGSTFSGVLTVPVGPVSLSPLLYLSDTTYSPIQK